LAEVFAKTEARVFQAPTVKGIVAKGMASDLTRNKLDNLTDRTKKMGAKGLAWFKVGDGGALDSPLTKFLSDEEQRALVSTMEAAVGDVLLLVADEWMTTVEVLGQLRNDLGRPPVTDGQYRYIWIVDFP